MADSNLIVDVSKINNLVSNVDKIHTEAKKPRYYVQGVWCTPLHIDAGTKPLKMEAVTLKSDKFKGLNSSKLTYVYHFNNHFTGTPVVVGTYDGKVPGANIRLEHISGNSTGKGKESVTIVVHAPSGVTWRSGNGFYVHLIVMGH